MDLTIDSDLVKVADEGLLLHSDSASSTRLISFTQIS
jgi:hypothetical protein